MAPTNDSVLDKRTAISYHFAPSEGAKAMRTRTFPRRQAGEPYVVVLYTGPDGTEERGFVLDGRYHLLGDATTEQIHSALSHHVDSWANWLPSAACQKPDWVRDLEGRLGTAHFIGYWVAE